MADKKTSGAASGKAIESLTDAVRIATEASLAPPMRPTAARRDAAVRLAVPRPVASGGAPAFDSSPAPLPAPEMAGAFVPHTPISEASMPEQLTAAAPAVAQASAPSDPTTTPTIDPTPINQTPINPTPMKMEKMMTSAEEMMSFQQGNLEALMKSGQIWAAGLQDLGRSWAATAQAHMDETMGTVKAIAGVKSLREAVELQSTLARTSVEKVVTESGKLTDASMKLAEQTIAPITARLTLAAERFGRTA